MRKSLKKLFRVYVGIVLFFVLCALGLLYCAVLFETDGLPGCVLNYFRKEFAERGLVFDAGKCRVGLSGGLVFEDFRLSSRKGYDFPSVSARQLRVQLHPWKLLRGVLLPVRVRVENGHAAIPLFPEAGAEGAADVVRITDFSLDAGGATGLVKIRKLSGRVEKCEFVLSGTIDNLLHSAAAYSGLFVNKKMLENAPPAAVRRKAPFIAAMEAVPLETRKKLMRFFESFENRQFDSPPLFHAHFHLDVKDFRKTEADAMLAIPDFRYGKLSIGSFREKLSLKDGVLQFRELKVDFGKNEYVVAQGKYEDALSRASGSFSGVCSLRKILLFVDRHTRENLLGKISFDLDTPIPFSGNLTDYSVASGNYTGDLAMTLPEMTFNGIGLKNIRCRVALRGGVVSGAVENAVLPGGNSVRADFTLSDNTFSATVAGAAHPDTLRPFLSQDAATFIYRHCRFGKDAALSFSGAIRSQDFRNAVFEGDLKLFMPRLECCGLNVNRMSAKLSFSSDTLKMNGLEAYIDDSLTITGSAVSLIGEEVLSADLVCRGTPGKTIGMLEPTHKNFIQNLTRDIVWPKKGSLMETSANFYVRFGKDPCYFINGTIVMADFKYRGIPFNYAASRFLIDSDKKLVLPGAILQTPQGAAELNVLYDGSARIDPRRPEKKTEPAVAGANPAGVLEFSLSSTMAGNDVMRCLYPEWKSGFLDFPGSSQVKASGVIDYLVEADTKFRASVGNGICYWKRAELTNIDATVEYADEKLVIRKATADACGGKLECDYMFDFKPMRGKIDLSLGSADFTSVLKGMNAEIKRLSGIRARVSGKLSADVSYDAADNLLLDGAGSADIRGNNLWSIPAFGELLNILGKTWNTKNLGSITDVDVLFSLSGTTFSAGEIKSNGSVVAIRGKGKYDWLTDEFDFRIRSELLKGTLPFEAMTKVLTPVSWILEKRLSGKADVYKWE